MDTNITDNPSLGGSVWRTFFTLGMLERCSDCGSSAIYTVETTREGANHVKAIRVCQGCGRRWMESINLKTFDNDSGVWYS